MSPKEFEALDADFNRQGLAYLDKQAHSMRERLLLATNTLVSRAFNQDMASFQPLRQALDERDRGLPLDSEQQVQLDAVRRRGVPIYLQNHDPVWEEFQVGTDFVSAISCRLVEPQFVSHDVQQRTMMHLWPTGAEMRLYMPVAESLPLDPTLMSEPPQPLGEDIFIKLSGPTENGKDSDSILYAIGPNYCYEHSPIGDVDLEMELMMQDIGEFAETMHINNLNLKQLVQFNELLVSMKRWPINTYWPGVNASDIAS